MEADKDCFLEGCEGELMIQVIGDSNFLCKVGRGGGGINGFQTSIVFIHSSLSVPCSRESVCKLLHVAMFMACGKVRDLVSHL